LTQGISAPGVFVQISVL